MIDEYLIYIDVMTTNKLVTYDDLVRLKDRIKQTLNAPSDISFMINDDDIGEFTINDNGEMTIQYRDIRYMPSKDVAPAFDKLISEGLISWYEYDVDEVQYENIEHTNGGDF